MTSQLTERDLKRSSASLLVLTLVAPAPRHGYEIGKLIEARSEGTISSRWRRSIHCSTASSSVAGSPAAGVRAAAAGAATTALLRRAGASWPASGGCGGRSSARSIASRGSPGDDRLACARDRSSPGHHRSARSRSGHSRRACAALPRPRSRFPSRRREPRRGRLAGGRRARRRHHFACDAAAGRRPGAGTESPVMDRSGQIDTPGPASCVSSAVARAGVQRAGRPDADPLDRRDRDHPDRPPSSLMATAPVPRSGSRRHDLGAAPARRRSQRRCLWQLSGLACARLVVRGNDRCPGTVRHFVCGRRRADASARRVGRSLICRGAQDPRRCRTPVRFVSGSRLGRRAHHRAGVAGALQS